MDKEELRYVPKRKLSDAEKNIIFIKIEAMKLEKEKSVLILVFGIILFLAFIAVAVVGLLNELITKGQLNMLVLGSLLVLIVSVFPYIRFVVEQQKSLKNTLEELIN